VAGAAPNDNGTAGPVVAVGLARSAGGRRFFAIKFLRALLPIASASVPIPKFARSVGTLSCELRNRSDPSKYIILVRFLDLKFLREFPTEL